MSYDVAGKVALVTGAGRGIGLAVARELAARGARVALLERDEDELAAATERVGPERSLALCADVCDRDAMAAAVAQVVEHFGRLDVVVANAGVAPEAATIRTMDPADWDRVIGVNLQGVFNTVHAAVEPVTEARGHMVVVSSVAAFVPGMGSAAYQASKAAVEQLGRALRLELAPHGASAGVAYFGLVKTRMVREHIDSDPFAVQGVEQLPPPLRRRITPEEAGQVIANGIARRAPRTIAPPGWRPYSLLRGLINVAVDRRIAGDRKIHALLREVEARRSRVPAGE